MILFCKECGQRYRIDDRKIPDSTTQLKCPQCSAAILLPSNRADESEESPLPSAEETPAETRPDQATAPRSGSFTQKITFRLLMPFVLILLSVAGCILYSYWQSIPSLMEEQINQRAFAISRSFSVSVTQPLLLRNYLAVNQSAALHAELPGVAYVAVKNRENAIVTGLFGSMDRFDPDFSKNAIARGFPAEILLMNPIDQNEVFSARNIQVGNRKIHDVAVTIRGNGGVVHVGLFMEDAEAAIKNSLKPLAFILSFVFLAGAISLIWVSSSLTVPLKKLTRSANAIALGELNTPVSIQGTGEIAELAKAIEAMRIAIRSAFNRLTNRSSSTGASRH
ncbi:zinc-ribbon domain-containing protein [Desulfobotulus sp. H1]|uniref:Zinc-ribbon domain-containing protein n=1 Tax=Desulfobotulus pelophilus TaxID=2823377 RepID=A0ABT3NBJ1_9BACT|nr:HAMP domain-containing protein [Desulfobotulus pelophilus]MCW7754824.1 zinc-ribbon domain-containing protein [Desulfobotulus pelophilus]